TAPVIDADDREIAQAISVIFLFNVIAALVFPTLGGMLGLTNEGFGLFAGTAINDTSSVTAAASAWDSMHPGANVLESATVVKLTRTLAIIPITLALACWQMHLARKAGGDARSTFSLKRAFPVFVLFFVQRLLPRLFDSKIFYGLALALPVALAVFSLYAGYVYNPEWPYERMALLLLSIALSGRFEIWHNVFWSAPLSLLGGLPTDGDEHHAIDNTFLAVPMNKGLLGAILVAAVFLLLLWRLAKKHRSTEVICLVALTLYLFMENKPFLLSANPFLLMLPVVFFNAETGKAQSES
ncbi:MAG: putative sulfate exporter family transporter, partial [Subdoligranulum variabile]|nr:putative sulfate exporter family transporter [Subdoligranulum variabile]